MQKTRFWLTTGVIACVLINALPIAAQNTPAAPSTGNIRLSLDITGPAEIFREFRKSGRNVAFLPMLKTVAGREAEDIEAALEAQAVNFFEEFAVATKGDAAAMREKTKKYNEKRYEEQKKNPSQSKAASKRLPRAIGKAYAGEDLFPMEYDGILVPPDDPDGPQVQRTETETDISATASDTRSMDMAGSTVTRTAEVSGRTGTDGKEIFTGQTTTTKTDIVSKTENKKLNLTDKIAWDAGFAICPDVQGRLSGRGKATFSKQAVITADGKAAAVSQETTVEFKITGFVNDDAVFTHFSIEADATESINGYDRARNLDLLGEDKGYHDGTGRIRYRQDDCKPPYVTEANEYGMKSTVDPVLTEGVVTTYSPLAGSTLLTAVLPHCASLIMIQQKNLMMNAISNIRNGACVDVECSAPKNTLKPSETIEITTVSVSKRDLDKFNAKLTAKHNSSPTSQMGTPKAVFVFTGDAAGGGTFLVESVSKRGIGLGMLQFGKEGENDLEKNRCDGNWHGTIEVRRSFEETTKETTKPGDLRSNPQLSGWKEIINRQKYEGTVRIEDLKLATPGTWVMNAASDITHSWYYLDRGFFTEPNECGWYVKKTLKDESGIEKREEGGATEVSDVTIQFIGNEYRIYSGIKAVKGTDMTRNWHHPSGYCQEKNNKPTDNNVSTPTSFDKVSISLEGSIDPASPDVLTGTKTETLQEGKETITITWNIKRCALVKPKPPVKKK